MLRYMNKCLGNYQSMNESIVLQEIANFSCYLWKLFKSQEFRCDSIDYFMAKHYPSLYNMKMCGMLYTLIFQWQELGIVFVFRFPKYLNSVTIIKDDL